MCEDNRSHHVREGFGSFSLTAAVRPPYNQSRDDPNYKFKKVDGVT